MAKESDIGFKELDIKLDRVIDAMLTKDDVRTIVQEELVEIKKIQKDILINIDKLTTTVNKLLLEYAAISVQLTRHDRWIRAIAEKTGLKLEN